MGRPAGVHNVSPEKLEEIVLWLEETLLTQVAVARRVGCGASTVYRINSRLGIRRYMCTGERQEWVLRGGRRVRVGMDFWDYLKKQRDHWRWAGNRGTAGRMRWVSGDRSEEAAWAAWRLSGREEIKSGWCLVRQCRMVDCVAPAHHRLMRIGDRIRETVARISAKDVAAIRQSRRPSRELAGKYRVSQRQINRIKDGTRW